MNMKKNIVVLLTTISLLLAGVKGYAQINIFEPCTNNTAVNSNVITGGNAYFTSGVNDPSGLGYLRLTSAPLAQVCNSCLV